MSSTAVLTGWSGQLRACCLALCLTVKGVWRTSKTPNHSRIQESQPGPGCRGGKVTRSAQVPRHPHGNQTRGACRAVKQSGFSTVVTVQTHARRIRINAVNLFHQVSLNSNLMMVGYAGNPSCLVHWGPAAC